MKLQYKIMTLVTTLIVALVLILIIVMYGTWFDSVQKQVALNAMDQAVVIADNRDVKENMEAENGYLAVNQAVESLYLKTGIQYLYIISNDGKFYAHPLPERINTPIKPNEIKLSGELMSPSYYYALSVDAMVEGYAPIYTEGIKTGYVVVGVFNGRILQTMKGQIIWLSLFALVAVLLGIGAAYLLSRNIKRDIFGLEPSEIALLLSQKDMILDHIGEGILASDHRGKLVMVNKNAQQLLGMTIGEGDELSQLPFTMYLTPEFWRERELYQFEWRLPQNQVLIVTIHALNDIHEKLGLLVKIEDMSLVRKRAEELTEMKQLTQALRAQNHEFMNKLHAIYGLIQLEAYDGAIDYIETITAPRQAMLVAIQEKIKVAAVGGLLLTKHSKLTEKHIELTIDEDTYVSHLPLHAKDEDLTSILGNLIDNSEEALKSFEDKWIKVGLFQDETLFRIVVSDGGPGMIAEMMEMCFEQEVSTKGKDRGYGLAIVKSIVSILGGQIVLSNDPGLVVEITLPMNETIAGGSDESVNR